MTDLRQASATGEQSSEGIARTVGGREYGGKHFADLIAIRAMPAPPETEQLVRAISSQSKLLALPIGVSSESIFDAYGADLELMHRYRRGFKATIEAAVRARADQTHADAQAVLGQMISELGDIDHEPRLDLGAEAAKLEPEALRGRIRQEMRDEIENLRESVVIWLHSLVECDILSVIEWHSPRAITYRFFRMQSSRKELAREVRDPGMSLHGREVTTRTQTLVNVEEERRDHTVLNARRHALDKYTSRVPNRIAQLINAIPGEIRAFVDIIDGTVSKEQVTRRTLTNEIVSESHSVWVSDPTPALFGTFALAGWGGSTPEAARATYVGHVSQVANKWLLGTGLAAAAAAMLIGRLGGPRNALIAMAVFAIIIAGHQFSLRWHGRNILS